MERECEKCKKKVDDTNEKMFVKNDGIFRKEYCEKCWKKMKI